MRLLLDTHLLIWGGYQPSRISTAGARLIDDRSNEVFFSAASIWEIAIKAGLVRADFAVDPPALRAGLLAQDYQEVPVTGDHALAVAALPLHHRDPFDRILVAQAACEGLCLLTMDAQLTCYPGHIRLV
ncbi:MAG: twitching motility protein PilT [Acidocella sp. 20-57-95]|nr:MAG: twitching motility protein PilT [Acidocella sp. 20-57-95]OYV61600.1 MAG: twitching motility protein PilT [Acidocella sp. 21-58-7]HQT64250.1 type II toxin-antitoxin system VapC family toxin [Acidocella sp.]HQU04676.1 type II toxin-antitoxin system VapC family toxin [Acidocella sp.]